MTSTDISVQRGIQVQKVFAFHHHIKAVTRSAYGVAVCYNVASQHNVMVCPLNEHGSNKKYSLSVGVSHLLYTKDYRIHIAVCSDLQLRVYNQHFKELQSIPLSSTILSRKSGLLFIGGVGMLHCWTLKHKLNKPLVDNFPIQSSVNESQLVVSLYHCESAELLCASCSDGVYLICTKSYKQKKFFPNKHVASITCGVIQSQLQYLITAANDGSIDIWSYVLNVKLRSLSGHVKAVTGLVLSPVHTSPHIITVSLDGTVRVWNLITLSQSHRLDLSDPILGITMSPDYSNEIFCYSKQWVNLFTILQVETVFSVVNSNMNSLKLVHVPEQLCCKPEYAPPPPRVLAIADDGCVRLISPKTGQTITILFPMFSTPLTKDVVYSPCEGKLFALLHTCELVVFTASTNPCSAKELWVAENIEENIICLVMCYVTERSIPVLLGGQVNGYISLIHSNKFKMTEMCPAHRGCVICLATPNTPSDIIVSYGGDELTIQIWQVTANSHKELVLMNMGTVQPSSPINSMALLQTRLCIAEKANNQILVYDVTGNRPWPVHNSSLVLKPIVHQHEDDHKDEVISITSSPHLLLFASSGKDGRLKVWDTNNVLLADIEMGNELGALCFASSRGDLLIGFQQQICIVKAELFLMYQSFNKGCTENSLVDNPIPFDPNLEFWYNSNKISTQPILQSLRSLHSTQNDNKHSSLIIYNGNVQCLERQLNSSTSPTNEPSSRALTAGSKQTSFNQQQLKIDMYVDSKMAQKHSQQYYAQQNTASQIMHEIVCINNNESKVEMAEGIFGHLSTVIIKRMCNFQTRGKEPHLPKSAYEVEQPVEAQNNSISTMLSDVMEPSSSLVTTTVTSQHTNERIWKWPIAPDGLIPNSIIKAMIGLNSASQTAEASENFLQRLINTLDRGKEREINENTKKCTSITNENNSIEEFELLTEEPVILVKESKEDLQVFAQRQMSTSELDISNTAVVECSTSSIYQSLQPASFEQGRHHTPKTNVSPHIQAPVAKAIAPIANQLSEEVNAHSVSTSSVPEPLSSSFIQSIKQTAQVASTNTKQLTLELPCSSPLMESQSHKQASPVNSKLKQHHSKQHHAEKQHKIPYHSQNSHRFVHKQHVDHSSPCDPLSSKCSEELLPWLHKKNQSTAVYQPNDATLSSKKSASNQRMEKTLIHPQQIQDYEKIERQLQYSNGRHSIHENDVNFLVSQIKIAELPLFQDVCQTVQNIDSQSLSRDQKNQITEALLSRLHTIGSTCAKSSILETIGKFGYHHKLLLTAILPYLTHDEHVIKTSAFTALRDLTGVTNRDQFHGLLINLGLLQHVDMNEDSILAELSARIGPHRNDSRKEIKIVLPTRQHKRVVNNEAVMSPLKASVTKRYTAASQPCHCTAIGSSYKEYLKHPTSDRLNAQYSSGRVELPISHIIKAKVSTNQVKPSARHCQVYDNKLRRLMVTSAATIAQSSPAIKMMLNSHCSVKMSSEAESLFKWSEVNTQQISTQSTNVCLVASNQKRQQPIPDSLQKPTSKLSIILPRLT